MPADALKWRALGHSGYRYKDSTGTAAGITRISLEGSTQNRSKCLVKGEGANLDDLALDQLDDSGLVVVQLVNDGTGACFESRFTGTDFRQVDDPARFKARSTTPGNSASHAR